MGSDLQRRELIGYACGTGTSTCVPETSSLQANRVFAPRTAEPGSPLSAAHV